MLLIGQHIFSQVTLIGSERFYELWPSSGQARQLDLYSDGTTAYIVLKAFNTSGVEITNTATLAGIWGANSTQNIGMSSISSRGSMTIPGIGSKWGFTATTVAHTTCYFEIQQNILLSYGSGFADQSNVLKVAFVSDVTTAPVVSSPVSVSSLLVSDVKNLQNYGAVFLSGTATWEISISANAGSLSIANYTTRVPSTGLVNTTILVPGVSYEVSSTGSIARRSVVQFILTPANYGGVGINTITPVTTLDVNGNIKIGQISAQACDASLLGGMRYNTTTKRIEVCTDISGSLQWNGLKYEFE